MKPLRVAVVGAQGRMGLEITKLLGHEKRLRPALAVVREGTAEGFERSTTQISGLQKSDIDVVIDFSSAALWNEVLGQCVREKIPLVSGVTGVSEKDFAALGSAAREIPILWAANMSLGIAVLKKMIRVVAESSLFEFQITETHHSKKKDAPSGTALDLQKTLEEVSGRTWPKPLAIRGGGVIGDHELHAMAAEEVLELRHRAIHRAVFARGALRAAEFVAEKPAGLYQIEDLL